MLFWYPRNRSKYAFWKDLKFKSVIEMGLTRQSYKYKDQKYFKQKLNYSKVKYSIIGNRVIKRVRVFWGRLGTREIK